MRLTTDAVPAGSIGVGRPARAVHCPADGRLVGTVPNSTAAEVEAVAEALRQEQPAWEDLGPDGRARHLRAWRNWFLDNERRLGEMVQAETGKSWADASLEPMIGGRSHQLLRQARRRLPRAPEGGSPTARPERRSGCRLVFRPYQLVGLITPWNGPIGNPLLDVVGALVAGCRRAVEAVGGHAAVVGRGGAGLAGGRRRPAGPGHRHRRRRHRSGGGRGRRHGDVHRVYPDRPEDRRSRRRASDPLQPRARREGRHGGPGRRRSGPGGGRRHLGRHVQRRAGLHLGRAGVRRGTRLRRVRGQGHRRSAQASASAATNPATSARECRRYRHAGPTAHRRAPRDRRRWQRGPDPRPAAGGGRRPVLRTDRPRRTWTTPWPACARRLSARRCRS